MRRTVVFAAIAALSFAVAGSAVDDEMSQAQGIKYENVTWYTIVNIDYHAHATREALELVYDHFMPAGKVTGGPIPRIMEYATGGEWDLCMIWRMDEGPAELEWELDPDSAAWLAALAELEGGKEQAEELLERYMKMINRYDGQIVREKNIDD